ncbi:CU044_5270 family protein [Actinomycetes bacterium KLBMP 9797]
MSADKKLMRTLAEARPRRLNPHPARRPDPAAIMAHPQPAGARRPVPRPSRRLVLAGLVPTVAVVAAGAVFLGTQGEAPPGGLVTAEATESAAADPATARELFLVAAERTEKAAATSGRYLVIADVQSDLQTVGPASRPYEVRRQTGTERWYPTGPDGTATMIYQSLGAKPASPEDEAAWRADGSPAEWTLALPKDLPAGTKPIVISAAPGPKGSVKDRLPEPGLDAGWLPQREMAALPTEPAALRRRLLDRWQAYSGDSLSDFDLFTVGMGIVQNQKLSPGIRAAAYRMLADVDGATTIGRVTDQTGRSGMAVGFARKGDGGHWSQSRLIIDPRTGQVLADESWDLGPGKAPAATGKLLSYTLVTSVRYTDEEPPR